jgi:uncharacterized RDD family membrane protein YckC
VSATERPYAGIVSRAVALAIDAATLTVGFAVASAVFGLILSLFTAVGAAALWSLVVAGYFVLSWTLAGETPGMRLMALRVIDRRGDPPGLGQALVRLAGMILAAIPFFAGYLLILVDDRRRGLQDMLAGTTVVYVPKTSVPGPAAAPAQGVSPAG